MGSVETRAEMHAAQEVATFGSRDITIFGRMVRAPHES